MRFEAMMQSDKWKTIGIGDGGNELGMGDIPEEVVSSAISKGQEVHCTVACDYLLVCGVSNWGALALLLAVAMLRKTPISEVINEPIAVLHERIVKACVAVGAVDGILGLRAAFVDGLAMAQHSKLINSMWKLGDRHVPE